MRLFRATLALALLCAPATAFGQAAPGKQIVAPAGYVPATAIYCDDGTNHAAACTFIGKQESFQLVAANAPSAAATVTGGDYILSQACTGYGTLALQALGPDGATWQTLLTKTAADPAGGTGLSLGSYASVRVTVTGTTGCNAILARVPA